MHSVLIRARERVRKGVERERPLEPFVSSLSRRLWPWPERWLLLLVALAALLDYLSTYAALEASGKPHLYESGPLASWALHQAGFLGLGWMNVAAVIALATVALAARRLYARAGFPGFARTAFVVVLLPYGLGALAATVNNLLLALA